MAEWIPRVGASHVGLHHRLILVIPVLSKTALFSLDVTKPNRFQQAVAVEGLLVNSEVVNKVVKEDVNEDVKEEVDEDVNEQRCYESKIMKIEGMNVVWS